MIDFTGAFLNSGMVPIQQYYDAELYAELAGIAAIFFGGGFLLWSWRKLRDPKTWFWLTQQAYIVCWLKTKANNCEEWLHKKEDILAGNQIIMDGDAYTIADQDEVGNPTRYVRYGRPLYLFQHGKMLPEAWMPGNTIDSYWTPQKMGEIADGVIEHHWNDPTRKDHTSALIAVVVLSLVVTMILVAVIFQQSGLLQQILQRLTGSQPTGTGPPVA